MDSKAPNFENSYSENVDRPDILTMNDLLGVKDIELIGSMNGPLGGSGAPLYPYLTKGMGKEWNRDNLQVFLDFNELLGGYDVTVISSDIRRINLPARAYMGDYFENTAKRSMTVVERQIQEQQKHRSARLMLVDGIESDSEIYIPANIEKPVTFAPLELFNGFHRELIEKGYMTKPINSTIYDIFQNDRILG